MALANRGGLPDALGAGGVQSRLPAGRGIYAAERRNGGGFTRSVALGRSGPAAAGIAVSAALTTDRVTAPKRQAFEQKVTTAPAVTQTSAGRRLPAEFYHLTDPEAGVQLPPHHRVDLRLLDNRELDKLVSQLGRNKATWRRALLLHEWLVDAGHIPDDRLCTTLIRVCGQHGQTFSALGVYEWMKALPEEGGAGLCPSVYTYTAAMRAALAGNVLEKALQIWNDVEDSRCQPDSRLCTAYIEVCTRLGQMEKALQMYQRMRGAPANSKMAPTVHAYTAAMRAATEGGKWQKALEIWQDMGSAGVEASGHAFAAAISACAAGGDWQRACSLFEQMLQCGIQPDVVSCTALISALATGGQWQQSEQVVSWMLQSQVRPNVRTYTALLNALGQAQQWQRAIMLLRRMAEPEFGGVEPNAYCYSALVKSLGEHGQWELAEKVFTDLEAEALGQRALRGQSMDGLSGFCNLPCEKLAHGLTSRMETWSLGAQPLGSFEQAPNSARSNPGVWNSPSELHGINVVASRLAQQLGTGTSDEGFSFFSDQASLSSIPLVNQMPEAVLQFGQQHSSAGGVASLVERISQLNVGQDEPSSNGRKGSSRPRYGKINEVVCGALMMSYSKAGKWSEAVNVLARARRLGIRPNTVMYNSAISAAGKSGQLDVVEALFREVPEPDAVTYETVIAAYGMAGDVDKAEGTFQQMVDARMQPRDYAYCGLIAAYSMAGDWQSALHVRTRMQRAGINLTVHVYNALIAACERCGRFDHALQLHKYMEAEGVEPNNVTVTLLNSVGKHGVRAVEHQQAAATALSAAVAAAGALMIQAGAF
ncbi:unnamed protein product [Ostreobium quekettii]|uniref:PROP1-like PPR domain-containing protein n=1 Tax=Ostreobium quekettii TaxID=121088 RepID=A0A8S1IL61_9CHLO|nr:unnamed protein product [Ostreobium quekettii]|eukprot:evm.model.scf_171.7 EVM.evm.TU.scf_171.7   scf_171:53700-58778(-)